MAILFLILAFTILHAGEAMVAKTPADHPTADDEGWLPVGMHVTDLNMIYGSEVADDSPAEDAELDLKSLDDCANGMALLAALPEYFYDQMMLEMIENVTLDDSEVLEDMESEVSEDQMVLSDQQLDSLEKEILVDEAVMKVKQEVDKSLGADLETLDDGYYQRFYGTARRFRAYGSSRCRNSCYSKFCSWSQRRCHFGSCKRRRCNTGCYKQHKSGGFCRSRPRRRYRSSTYCCPHSYAPRVYKHRSFDRTRCNC